MVEVMVGIDEIFDRLGRKHPFGFGDRRHCSIVTRSSLDDDKVVFELDEQALRRSQIQKPDAVSNLLRLDRAGAAFAAARPAAAPLGIASEFASCGTVRFDVGNSDVEDRMTTL